MCQMNPKHSRKFVLEAWTSLPMDADKFLAIVMNAALNTEMELNKDMRVRWHIHETEEPQ